MKLNAELLQRLCEDSSDDDDDGSDIDLDAVSDHSNSSSECFPPLSGDDDSDDDSDDPMNVPPPRLSYTPCNEAKYPGAEKVYHSGMMPKQMIQIVVLVVALFGAPETINSVELFAGCQSITNGVKAFGHSACALDISTISPNDDMNTSVGFLRSVMYVLGLNKNGLLWAAPPCSSWIFLTRYSTGRNQENPMGDDTEYVQKANQQVSRVLLLCMVSMVLSAAVFMAEQPASSICDQHARWSQLQICLGDSLLTRTFMWMQPYGGSSPKGTYIYNNLPLELSNDLFLPLDGGVEREVETYNSYVDAAGKRRVTGSRDLTSTQAYPQKFGRKVGSLVSNVWAAMSLGSGYSFEEFCSMPCSEDPWDDADLTSVLNHLREVEESRQ
jgi:hypothetical protein